MLHSRRLSVLAVVALPLAGAIALTGGCSSSSGGNTNVDSGTLDSSTGTTPDATGADAPTGTDAPTGSDAPANTDAPANDTGTPDGGCPAGQTAVEFENFLGWCDMTVAGTALPPPNIGSKQDVTVCVNTAHAVAISVTAASSDFDLGTPPGCRTSRVRRWSPRHRRGGRDRRSCRPTRPA